jgi:hypothetical protein
VRSIATSRFFYPLLPGPTTAGSGSGLKLLGVTLLDASDGKVMGDPRGPSGRSPDGTLPATAWLVRAHAHDGYNSPVFLGKSFVHIFKEFAKRNSKASGNGQQGAQRRDTLAPFNQAHRGTVQPTMVCKGFLREVLLCPQLAQSLTKCHKNLLHPRKSGGTI